MSSSLPPDLSKSPLPTSSHRPRTETAQISSNSSAQQGCSHLPTVIGVTGASGTILAFRLIRELLLRYYPVEVVFTEKALQVMHDETALQLRGHSPEEKCRSLLSAIDLGAEYLPYLQWFGNHDIAAPPASGTHRTQGMVVIPCSMGTLAKIATGISDSLLVRATDVTLKEHRKLIIVPRETPLSSIHLRHMLSLSEMGVRLIPPMLSFYLPAFHSLEGQISYTIAKVLDHLDVPHELSPRWGEVQSNETTTTTTTAIR